MDAKPGPGRSWTEYKTRKPHRKSRNGCTKCKKRRIKCDELMPRCSRCNKMNLSCQYLKRPLGPLNFEDYWRGSRNPLLLKPEVFRTDPKKGDSERPGGSFTVDGCPFPSALSVPPARLLDRKLDSSMRSHVARMLTPTEFELFEHYIEHTSRDLTVDDDEQHTLQIGIPNLACESRPLMKSVLAIAAVCKCYDIISQPPVSHEGRGQVLQLLSLAHQYHMDSLREIQASLPETKHYDYVLANAAMMGMYGSGSHCARIWLATTATFSNQSPVGLMPKHSQWIRLFRAVHLAYAGILYNTQGVNDTIQPSLYRHAVDPTAMQYEYKGSALVEQQRNPIDHVLYPILAATVGSAVSKLHKKARETAIVQASNQKDGCHNSSSTSCNDLEFDACFTALAIFDNIVIETFTDNFSAASTPDYGNLAPEVDIDPVGQLSEVSPWLRKYTASITSMIPSKLPRRIIMAFIHKVPTRYLTLVEETISLIQTESPVDEQIAWDSSTFMTANPSISHLLAIDIFAHWLVLVILLDNVWWIGGIGVWELMRVVPLKKYMQRRMFMWEKNEDWWPESMLEVSRHLEKHRTQG
ncbi:hypothetical protein BGW36DRAFT_336768 [Talaromyces proteolyticus]|uniref:Zn(2)-C6 fungal-type domain-containing protein n=1 Tax=Talaromyces proteolyticus TaxID=1131652 RepID=A0AAD4KY00_9EURO|nr:uncharacterized protein BGW36DRAFT_336768 [Talaromyces proteolyticus]KAH8702340.1 hypothetical protein BGW36DRAFT_336768 [Talaromyces proteolyticus]